MSAPVPVAEPGGLAGHLDGFVRAVREAGIPVGISQAVDAAEILTVVDLLEREREIVLSRVPDLAPGLAEQLVRTIRALRALELKKSPSISETLDWAQTLLELGLDTLDETAVRSTLGVVLKHASDQERAAAELRLN